MKIRALIVCFAAASLVARAGEPQLARNGLILDLDADKGVTAESGKVLAWQNQVEWKARDFKVTKAGSPVLKKSVADLRGHDAIEFHHQSVINDDEDAFDHLITGGGYTWLAVIAPLQQKPQLKDVNCFFGNLKNGGNCEGLWGNFNDDSSIWIGSRNGITFGRWNSDNPKVDGPKLDLGRFYAVVGRMGAGTKTVPVELFVNDAKVAASLPFPVNPKANPSKMAIGEERDAANHPGKECFDGLMARFLIWDRPLTDGELAEALLAVKTLYGVK